MFRQRSKRAGMVLGIGAAALSLSVLAGMANASAATGTYFNTKGDVSQVTGYLSFSGSKTVVLTSVHLYDTACDSRGAVFALETNHGMYSPHAMDSGCNTSQSWSSLSGTDDSAVTWARVDTWAENSTGSSSYVYGKKIYR